MLFPLKKKIIAKTDQSWRKKHLRTYFRKFKNLKKKKKKKIKKKTRPDFWPIRYAKKNKKKRGNFLRLELAELMHVCMIFPNAIKSKHLQTHLRTVHLSPGKDVINCVSEFHNSLILLDRRTTRIKLRVSTLTITYQLHALSKNSLLPTVTNHRNIFISLFSDLSKNKTSLFL